GAGGSKVDRHREEDDPLTLEDLAQGDVFRSALLHLLELQIERERVANLDRHVSSLGYRVDAGSLVAGGAGGGNGAGALDPARNDGHLWPLRSAEADERRSPW